MNEQEYDNRLPSLEELAEKNWQQDLGETLDNLGRIERYVAGSMALLQDCLDAFNELPRTSLSGEPYNDTYELASALSKFLKKQ
jgi:hypothetical protein